MMDTPSTFRIGAPLGKTLRQPVDVVLHWAAEHMPAIEQARRTFDAEQDGSA